MGRSRSPTVRARPASASRIDFRGALADRACFAIVRVPSLRGFDDDSILLTCADPYLTLRVKRGAALLRCGSAGFVHHGDPLELVDRLLERLRPRRSSGLTFEAGVVGFLGYELLDPPSTPRSDLPDAWLAFPRRLRTASDGGVATEITIEDLPSPASLARDLDCVPVGDGLIDEHRESEAADRVSTRHQLDHLMVDDHRDAFLRAVGECRRWIAAGDIYQANVTHQLDVPLRVDARALAIASSRRHPTPHETFLDCGELQLVGASPELFLRRRGHRIAVRPIKGTRPRGATPSQDEALRGELARNPKEAAEHVMIVDLERNDLGRVARTGTVRVPQLMTIETFGTLHHLVSTVTAEARPGTRVGEILRATFPCGSVTGAPKIRARQLIRDVELGPRGPYTGATGFIDCRGNLELAVAIRTAVVTPSRVRYGVGAGIVTDSVALDEWEETLLKAAAFSAALHEVRDSRGRVEGDRGSTAAGPT